MPSSRDIGEGRLGCAYTMSAPASYCLWILCDVGFLRSPDQRLVMALGLGGEDPGWVSATNTLDGAFVARVTELITDATTVVVDVPREVSAQLAHPAAGGGADHLDVVALQRLTGWRGAGSVTHRRLESRLADLALPSGPEGGDCSTTSQNLRFVRRFWRGVRGVRGGALQQQRNSLAEPKMNLLVPATPGCDRQLLAAARALANPTTHVAMLHSSPWIDAQLAASIASADRRIHTAGHLAPLDDPTVLASRDQRGRRQQHERDLMARWAAILLATCLVGILALAVLPVALAWDAWRVPLWAVAGCTGLAWLWFAARIARHLRAQPAS